MNKLFHPPSIASFLLLAGGIILVHEWLRPLPIITDSTEVHFFGIYFAICMLASYLLKSKALKFFIKASAIILILNYFFLDAVPLSSEWFQEWTEKISFQFEWTSIEGWQGADPFFRTFLFLLLLWLLSYLLHYWIIIAKRFLPLIIMTVIYLAIIDTFTDHDAKYAVIRVGTLSLFMLMINHYIKKTDEVLMWDRKEVGLQWFLPLTLAILIGISMGLFLPKLQPVWPDPVPFLTGAFGKGALSDQGVKKVGYGENDSVLGGSFVQDDTVVLEVVAQDRLYWRIESKDLYTGKGWVRSKDIVYKPLENTTFTWQSFSPNAVDTETKQATVTRAGHSSLSKVPLPYGTKEIISELGNTVFMLDEYSGMIEAEGSEYHWLTYQLTFEKPTFNESQLRKDNGAIPKEIQETYLQLPNNLPDRVANLAREITETKNNTYDQVKAIESYFHQNGFSYQVEDINIPEDDQDYVDQFLFDTKVGYCDNFSTSMVVMLRTLGIPARWVKGFTGGVEAVEQPPLPNNYKLYEISNNNAHSWVEVYFPEAGWIPFEPTAGFSNPLDFESEEASEQEEEQATEERQETVLEEQEEEEESSIEIEEEDKSTVNSSGIKVKWSIVILAILATIGITLLLMLILKRRTITNWWFKRQWSKLLDNGEIEKAYFMLTKRLEKKGYLRQNGQTLRQYAADLKDTYDLTDFYQITLDYEEWLYNKNIDMDINQWRKHFQSIFNQISA